MLKRSLAATTDCDGDELNAFVGLLYVRRAPTRMTHDAL
jgi:hypothetical protein